MAEKRGGFWQGFKEGWEASGTPRAEAREPSGKTTSQVLFSGLVDSAGTNVTVYKDGTFTSKKVFAKQTAPERLMAVDHDIDSMRRKSAAARGAAALVTGGLSLAASNNRGVVYVVVTGEKSGVQTFTSRNPSDGLLKNIRSLKAAGDAVTMQSPSQGTGTPSDITEQLTRLTELHRSGGLTDQEFTAAKARLLS